MVLALIGVSTKNYGMFIGLIFLVMAWQSYREMKRWEVNSKELRFSFDGPNLVISGLEFENKLVLSSVKKVVVQTRKNQPISVLLFPTLGSLEKIEGVSDMQSFVTEIKGIVGNGKVKHSRFFHR